MYNMQKQLEFHYKLASAKQITEGDNWYHDAHLFAQNVSSMYKVSLEKTCGVISALSPAVRWDTNKRQAEAVIKAHVLGLDLHDVIVSTYRRNLEKAITILQCTNNDKDVIGDIVNGNKTKAFYYAILDPYNPAIPVIDRWILRAAGLEFNKISTKVYQKIADCLINIAIQECKNVHNVQAIIWLVIREGK